MIILSHVESKVTGIDAQRRTFFEYFFVSMLILYAGRGNTFFESTSIIDNPIGVLLPIVLSVILAIRSKIIFNKQLYLLILCFFIYFIAITIKFGEFRPTIFLVYFFLFFVVYTSIKALKFNLFILYERLFYYMAIMGLALWGVQIILGGDSLYSYVGRIPSINSFSNISSGALNIIVYSVQPAATSLLYGISIPRNCGYAWEPGAFAVYICMAIFINLFVVSSDKKSKRRFWIFVVALISTQSTTGYIIFLMLIFYYFFNKNFNLLVLLMPILLIAVITLFSLPFMGNKIVEVFNQASEVDVIVENSVIGGSAYSPGRFASFLIALEDFLNNPILGLGTVREEGWTYKVGASISPISGIGNLLAQFGIVGFLFFIYYSIKSSLLFAKSFEYKGKYLFFLLIILISVSYSVIFLPLVMSCWMFSLFEPSINKMDK